MAAQCATVIAEHHSLKLPLVLHHRSGHQWSSQVHKFSKDYGVPRLTVTNVNDPDALDMVKSINPDVIFSVNNWDVIRSELLSLPPDGIINFHNGPLPQYRGVNAPSWAIINRERDYGVSWHFVEKTIDTGDIVATKEFTLSPEETAISLMFRCIEAGVELLPSLLDRYTSGTLDPRPQAGDAHYYSAKDSPNQGYLELNQYFEQLSALVRGLSFRPFENQFTYPKIRFADRTLLVSSISPVRNREESERWTCGEVRQIVDGAIVVCAVDCEVRLSGLMDENLVDIGDADAIRSIGIETGLVLDNRTG